jgi:uncharacterized membrane protein/YHS domain-containing protein
MVFYFVTIVHAFVPAALLVGLAASRSPDPLRGRAVLAVACVMLGLAAGWAVFTVASRHRGMVEATTAFRIVAILVFAGVLTGILAGRRSTQANRTLVAAAVLAILAVLSANGAFDALVRTADRQLSVTGVVNTEMVVNLTTIVVAAMFVAGLFPLVAHAACGAGRWATIPAAMALAVALASATGDVMLGLLQLDLMEASSSRVSLIARIDQIDPFVIYAELAAAAALGCLRFLHRPRHETGLAAAALRRKHLAAALAETRWLGGTLAAACALAAMLLYQDLYASQPARLSDAAVVTADDTGHVAILIDAVKDGRLHRFAYIASDGHRVRFFLINRYGPDRPRIGVVYDACMLCGDDGYIQAGNEVICVSCDVRIHVPSIGTPGGCNPIPLDHQVDGGTIRISAAELEKASKFFSEVVTIEVRDPVSGARLTNVAAPFQDSHDGRVFFFAGKDTYEAFRADPDKYAPPRRPAGEPR